MKESSHVFDCNGCEIFVGDRVRIIGKEVAKFLLDSYGDALPESVLSDGEDEVGIVVDDDFLQIVNENGDMLADLSLSEAEQESMLEVVASIQQETHKHTG